MGSQYVKSRSPQFPRSAGKHLEQRTGPLSRGSYGEGLGSWEGLIQWEDHRTRSGNIWAIVEASHVGQAKNRIS